MSHSQHHFIQLQAGDNHHLFHPATMGNLILFARSILFM